MVPQAHGVVSTYDWLQHAYAPRMPRSSKIEQAARVHKIHDFSSDGASARFRERCTANGGLSSSGGETGSALAMRGTAVKNPRDPISTKRPSALDMCGTGSRHQASLGLRQSGGRRWVVAQTVGTIRMRIWILGYGSRADVRARHAC